MQILSNEQTQRLLDIAYFAAHNGQIHQANIIFEALLMQNKDFSSAIIGKALINFMLDDFAKGEEIIRTQVLAKNPNDAEARAVLALGLFLANNLAEAKAEANIIVNTQGNAAELAKAILAEL